jgi:hypothetical protein
MRFTAGFELAGSLACGQATAYDFPTLHFSDGSEPRERRHDASAFRKNIVKTR